MSKTLYAFIWKYSTFQQMVLLVLTVISFPLLYVTLELPKRIINEVIGSSRFPIDVMGFSLERMEYLQLLCGLFLLTVIISGVLKMRTNIYKGIVAERLLRRFRFQLVARILRFPLPYFRHTPQGGLISMVTSESERLGTMMGDALATPVFSAGQMLTIATFLFIQNFWLGMSAIIMIPIQAYVIPKLQRKINNLNRKRILEVRRLSNKIGESVNGVEVLRNSNGLFYTLADYTARLGAIFRIRVDIYNLKFFMKFLNNFMNQATPFLFLSIGGYLVIHGRLSVGALTAAIASYKDLLAPWRALLAYYNQVQDSNLRYATILEQFDPPDMIDEDLIFKRSENPPVLDGQIKFSGVTVSDQYGSPVLNGVTAEFDQGSYTAIACDDPFARSAFVQALTRSVILTTGTVTVGGEDLSQLHQDAIASQIATAGGTPHIFDGSIAQNAQMSLMRAPLNTDKLPKEIQGWIAEAKRVGNSTDPLQADWLDPKTAGFDSVAELHDWWLEIIRAVGIDDLLLYRGLDAVIDPDTEPELARRVLSLRKELAPALHRNRLAKSIDFFDPEQFNPLLDISENALFAIRNRTSGEAELGIDSDFRSELDAVGMQDLLRNVGIDLLNVLVPTFAEAGPGHPMFRRLAMIDPDVFDHLKSIHQKQRTMGLEALQKSELDLVMSLPFVVRAEQFEEAFPVTLKSAIVHLRRDQGKALREQFADRFTPLETDGYCRALTVLDNILFGRISVTAGVQEDEIERFVVNAIGKAGLTGDIILFNMRMDAGQYGANLPQNAQEYVDFVRAVIRKPKVLILNRIFPGADPARRADILRRTRTLLPSATILAIESRIQDPRRFDQYLEIEEGELVAPANETGHDRENLEKNAESATGDLEAKIKIISRIPQLAGLQLEQMRLLAYGAQRVHYDPGDHVFRSGDRTDGAYVFTLGKAELWIPESVEHEASLISKIEPLQIIGDLAVVMQQNRRFDLIASTDLVGLRFGSREFLDVVEHDHQVALNLLRSVSGHLLHARDRW